MDHLLCRFEVLHIDVLDMGSNTVRNYFKRKVFVVNEQAVSKLLDDYNRRFGDLTPKKLTFSGVLLFFHIHPKIIPNRRIKINFFPAVFEDSPCVHLNVQFPIIVISNEEGVACLI